MNSDASPNSAGSRGVEHPGVIDLLTHDAKNGRVTLTMVEPRPWDGSEVRLFQLQEKLNAYVSFALDGELAESYPAIAGLPLHIVLECATYPDEATIDLLEKVREQLGFQQIDLQVVVKERITNDE
ncbi:MAG TPA: DUF6572 domain-containing protein [Chthoniobacteraceae bacterium]|jgi:hypothetical protein|nr:DUF6572 domain-containing protein [Chthoniobacteraceae bacterium]